MQRRWIVGGLVLGLVICVTSAALLAKPGTVTNKQGQAFKGDITEDEKFVYVSAAGGQLTIDKRNVGSIQYDVTVDDQYNARHAKLAANDVVGRIDLANWANDNQRADLAVAALTEARKIDPTNRDAARALDSAQKQLDLDNSAKGHKNPPPATPSATAPAAENTAPVTTPTPDQKSPLPHRLLNAEEINLIRQKEMSPDDAKLRVKFDSDLVKRYLASGDHDAKQFAALTPAGQADAILATGDPKMIKGVHILNDPASMLDYKLKIQPIVALGCGSLACHGGNKGGDFSLFSGSSTAITYTNFFILQTYSSQVDKVKYLAMDREVPENSLILQYGLPANIAKPAHPTGPGWKPRFHTVDEPAYRIVVDYLKSLRLPQPTYDIKVSATIPVAPSPDAAKQ